MATHEERELSPEERALVREIDAAYRPEPLGAPRRAEMLAAVERRARKRSRVPLLVPAFAAGALAVALAVWVGSTPVGLGQPDAGAARAPAGWAWTEDDSWEAEVLLGDLGDEGGQDADLDLPEDYLAIEDLVASL